jgi:hypothetical protein
MSFHKKTPKVTEANPSNNILALPPQRRPSSYTIVN